MRIFIFTLCLVAFSSSRCIGFQSEAEVDWLTVLSNQPRLYSYSMHANGFIMFNHYPRTNSCFAAEEFYIHDSITNELELSTNQRSEIENAFKRWTTDLERKLLECDKIEEAGSSNSRAEALSKIRTPVDRQLTRTIDSTLSAKQERRLQEIQVRFLIHQYGFFQVLNREDTRGLLDLPKFETKGLEKRQREIAKNILQQKQQATIEACEIWLGDLSTEQRKLIDARWPTLMNGFLTQQLILQLDSKLKRREFDKKEPFETVGAWPVFEHDVAGSCAISKSAAKTTRSAVDKVRLIQSYVNSKHFRQDIELVDVQIRKFEEIMQRFHEVKMSIGRGIDQSLPNPKKKQLFDQAIEADALACQGEYLSVFLPHQLDLLSLVMENIRIRFQGPLAEMLWGDLGKALEIDDKAKEKLKENADGARKFLEKESKRIYDDAIEQLIGAAPKRAQGQLRSVLGPKFKDFSPNLDGFVAALLLDFESSKHRDGD